MRATTPFKIIMEPGDFTIISPKGSPLHRLISLEPTMRREISLMMAGRVRGR